MDLYYQFEENGYFILDRNDPLFRIHQYAPYIPDPSKTLDENAQAQIAAIMAQAEADTMDDPMFLAGYEQALLDMAEETGE